ncbi:hypothetical protein BJ085DRAFT_39803 [Dimargaris cristalligena]|uniref:Uncharacterized protein n=1 Tax=Dimargaris cristalligena TaxID=215637 RepID=A0A4P9ZL22_9FUNG|nr:hypothetical protein BJ085DRAFT_39803 [Dimargaris cristalligena]|eukprot:RKP33768.1 hypothetical protein BJ085DRAFT_39803 [Dimargaris cristalligena]
MTAAILINFYALAGALRSKTPLPPYLPSGRAARIRLISQIRSHLAHARPHLDDSSTYPLPDDDSSSSGSDSDDEDSAMGRHGRRERETASTLPSGASEWSFQNPRSQPANLFAQAKPRKSPRPRAAPTTPSVNGSPSTLSHRLERDSEATDVASPQRSLLRARPSGVPRNSSWNSSTQDTLAPPTSRRSFETRLSTVNEPEKAAVSGGDEIIPSSHLQDSGERTGNHNDSNQSLDQSSTSQPQSQTQSRHHHRRRRSTLAPTDNQYHLGGGIHHDPHRKYNQYVPTQHSHLVPPDHHQVDGAGRVRSPLASFDEGNESEDEDEWLSMHTRRTSRTLDQTLTHRYPGDEGGGEEQSFETSAHVSQGPLGSGPEPSQHFPPPLKEVTPASGKPPGKSQRPPRKYMLSTFYWYAYSAALEEVIEELENIVILVKSLVGENDVLHELLDSPGW